MLLLSLLFSKIVNDLGRMSTNYSAVSFHGPVSCNFNVSLGESPVDDGEGAVLNEIANQLLDLQEREEESDGDYSYGTQEDTSEEEEGEESSNEHEGCQKHGFDWSEIYPDLTTEAGRTALKEKLEKDLGIPVIITGHRIFFNDNVY